MLFNICASSVLLLELVKLELEQVIFMLFWCAEYWTFDQLSRRVEE